MGLSMDLIKICVEIEKKINAIIFTFKLKWKSPWDCVEIFSADFFRKVYFCRKYERWLYNTKKYTLFVSVIDNYTAYDT